MKSPQYKVAGRSRNSSDDEDTDILNLQEDDGWEDVEPDIEKVNIVSLLDNEIFDDVPSMLQHCKDVHNFDLRKVQKELSLDFMDLVKLVNYIRTAVRDGQGLPEMSAKVFFRDDRWLKPVLEDDSLLYSLGDMISDEDIIEENARDEAVRHQFQVLIVHDPEKAALRLEQYEAQIRATEEALLKSTQQLELTQKALERANILADQAKAALDEQSLESGAQRIVRDSKAETLDDPYLGISIHRQMLQDRVRTEAYRDFILGNKHLFEGKAVLDVGCGTGILSMFCAQAGAKQVYAVEQSMIYQKAQKIIFDNGFQDVVKVLHGKVEEIHLPVAKVDIIVSEWMGYALLYEGMLDSVIWARDHYLAPGGLIIPSHTSLHVAPFANHEYASGRVNYWDSVYGFDMSAMSEDIERSVDVSGVVPADKICGTSSAFMELDMYEAQVKGLSFQGAKYSCKMTEVVSDVAVDGLAIWFDIHFCNEPRCARGQGDVMFSTAPDNEQTHWGQAVLLFDRTVDRVDEYEIGDLMSGEIGYAKGREAGSLEITATWELGNGRRKGRQTWVLV